jgi:hypothetical protein
LDWNKHGRQNSGNTDNFLSCFWWRRWIVFRLGLAWGMIFWSQRWPVARNYSHVETTKQNTIKWGGCSISSATSNVHIVCSHPQKAHEKVRSVECFHTHNH